MKVKEISLEDYQKHIKESRQKVLKNKEKYIVYYDWKPVFEVTPIIHRDSPEEIDWAMRELKK